MNPGQRNGPGGNPGRSTRVSATDRLTGQYRTDVRQDEADALFGITGNAYGSASYRLPDDPPPGGQERKQVGLRAAYSGVDNGSRAEVLRVIREFAVRGVPFTNDDVRAAAKDVVMSPQAWGSCFSATAKRGIIRRLGFVQSERDERHGGFVSQWVGVQ